MSRRRNSKRTEGDNKYWAGENSTKKGKQKKNKRRQQVLGRRKQYNTKDETTGLQGIVI